MNNQRDCNQATAGSDGYPQEKSDFSRTQRAQSLSVQSALGTETQLLLDSGPMTASPCGSPSAVSTQPCRMARHPLVLFCCGWQPARGSALTPRLPPNTSLLVPAGSRVPCPQAQRRSPFPAAHFGATFKAVAVPFLLLPLPLPTARVVPASRDMAQIPETGACPFPPTVLAPFLQFIHYRPILRALYP